MGHPPVRGTVAAVMVAVGVGALGAGCSTTPTSSGTTVPHRAVTTAPPSVTTRASTSTTVPASVPSTTAPPATTAPAGAPCTQSAIAAGAGATATVNGFGCTGNWAYASVTVGHGTAAYTAVMVLSASGGAWQQATRAAACNTRAIAPALYTRACTTS